MIWCFFFSSFLVLSSSSPPPKRKNFLSFSLSLFTEKNLQKRKKKVRLKSIRRRRKNRRRREILVAFTVESFYLLAKAFFLCRRVVAWASFVVAFLFLLHFLARDTSLEEDFCERKKGACDFFLLGLWVRVKNVVGVLVADANAWMQILNFKCVRRVRLPAKEGLNCSSSRLAVMMLARDFFSSRACDKDLSLTTLLLFSLLFHSYTKQQAERKQTHTYT